MSYCSQCRCLKIPKPKLTRKDGVTSRSLSARDGRRFRVCFCFAFRLLALCLMLSLFTGCAVSACFRKVRDGGVLVLTLWSVLRPISPHLRLSSKNPVSRDQLFFTRTGGLYIITKLPRRSQCGGNAPIQWPIFCTRGDYLSFSV